MQNAIKGLSILAVAAVLAGCRDDGTGVTDTITDRAPDVVDVRHDVTGDPDVPADVPSDRPADGDAAGEEPPPGCHSIAQVRAAADGTVDYTLCRVLVTYVMYAGYFVQSGPTGPAIQIYEGNTWTPDRAVGDELTLRVTGLTSYKGQKEVNAHDTPTVHSTGASVTSLVQDLSAGTLPGEDLESELVKVAGAAVTAIADKDVTVSYGTATGVTLRVASSTALCVGATFNLLGVVTEWSDSSIHRLQSFADADFSSINTIPCSGGGRAPVAGDLIVNELLADPGADAAGDANCDGTRDGADDEFVEIVNVSADTIVLDGVKVSDGTAVRHTFPAGTSLAPGKAFLVFGGGTISCTLPSDVKKAVASGGMLGLNNETDTVTIADGGGATISAVTYGADAGDDQSLTLNPDLNDTDSAPAVVAGYVKHSVADTADASKFSPGTKLDGTAF